MVLEKYDYLATVNFSTLENHNQTRATPSSFFATGTNTQGYDGLFLTTVTDPPGEDGSRKLTVTITWGGAGPRQSFQVFKYLAPGTGSKAVPPSMSIWSTKPVKALRDLKCAPCTTLTRTTATR
jgi:hypothetical protein